MLGIQQSKQSNQMPYAVPSPVTLPSLTSWPRQRAQKDDAAAMKSASTSAWLSAARAAWTDQRPYSNLDSPTPAPRLPFPTTSSRLHADQYAPSADTSPGYGLGDDTLVNGQAASGLAALRSIASGVGSLQSNSLDSSLYHYPNCLLSNPSSKPERTPDSQRTYSSQADSTAHMSPSKRSVLSNNLSIPDTISTPQEDLSELAAEVRIYIYNPAPHCTAPPRLTL
jgi:hypothetical protein